MPEILQTLFRTRCSTEFRCRFTVKFKDISGKMSESLHVINKLRKAAGGAVLHSQGKCIAYKRNYNTILRYGAPVITKCAVHSAPPFCACLWQCTHPKTAPRPRVVIVNLSVSLSVRLTHTNGLCPLGSNYDHDFFTIWQLHDSSFLSPYFVSTLQRHDL